MRKFILALLLLPSLGFAADYKTEYARVQDALLLDKFFLSRASFEEESRILVPGPDMLLHMESAYRRLGFPAFNVNRAVAIYVSKEECAAGETFLYDHRHTNGATPKCLTMAIAESRD